MQYGKISAATCLVVALIICACRESKSRQVLSTGASGSDREPVRLIVEDAEGLPSELPWKYGDYLDPSSHDCILAKSDLMLGGFMTWSFYGGQFEGTEIAIKNLLFFFAMNPDHIRPMMRELQDFDPKLVQELKNNRKGCVVGQERLKLINKSVGDEFKLASVTHKGIDLEFEVIGLLPAGLYEQSAIMNVSYLREALANYKRKTGQQHPQADKSLNLIYLRAVDRDAAQRLIKQIESAPQLATPPLRCQVEEEYLKALAGQ
jgi:putative ABC transport system permease protein